MKILIIHNFYQQSGGEDAVVREEAELLTQHGEDVSLFSLHNDDINGLWAKLWAGVTVVYNPLARKRLSERLRSDRPDIVHVHNFFPLLSPSIFAACADANIPSVMTLHNFRILCPSCFLYFDDKLRERSLHHSCWWTVPKRVYRNSFAGTFAVAAMVELHKRLGTWRRSVDRFIALTRFAKSKFVEGGLPAERIIVKGNAIAEPSAPKVTEPRHGALYVGRLSEQKGLITLIEAWEDFDYPLKVIGAGPLRDWIEANAGDNVQCLGHLSRNEVHVEMHKASFLLMPSLWHDMFPIVALDAFACGLPIIASNLESLQDIIENGTTGLHFRAGDANHLAAQVRWAIAHPMDMLQYGKNGRRKYNENYTPQINYRNLMTLYQDAIRGRQDAHK